MFSFLRRSSSRSSSALPAMIHAALLNDGLSSETDPGALRLLEQPGSYSGRRVKFFRVFDSARAAERGVNPRAFTDLDAHPDLVLANGHIEHGGAVSLMPRRTDRSPQGSSRELADRANHADDERIVFPNESAP